MKKLSILMLVSFYSVSLFSQEELNNTSDTLRKYAINIFMDQQVPDFFKEQVPFVNFVRDKNVADLVIIHTEETTGSGGAELSYFIEGQFKFEGVKDTIKYVNYPGETEDMIRSRAVKAFKRGLVKYIIDTPLMEYLDITFSQPISANVSSDKWNNWVVSVNLNGSLNRDASTRSDNINSSISAGRVTENWKISSGLNTSYSYTHYDYGDFEAENTARSSRIWGDVVKSLNDHWSLGISANVGKSIFSNYDLQLSFNPTIEYNIFPYSESSRRMFTIRYNVLLGYNNYADTTVFFKTDETYWSQTAAASFTTIQNWGNISLMAYWANYLHDFSLNKMGVNSKIEWRIAKGLNIGLWAGYSFIHDQISLRKGGSSYEDVLLKRYELSTNYSFYSTLSLTYTFGSIYNNVVNQRLVDLW